jgi:hypothetical protein
MGKIVNLLPPRPNASEVILYSYLKVLGPTDYQLQSAIGQGGYILPLPKELNDTFPQEWQQKELGADFISGLIGGGSTGSGVGSTGSLASNAVVAGASSLEQVGVLGGAIAQFQRSQGLTQNKINTLMFQSPGLRTFQFSWDLIPTNAGDGGAQQNMIKDLRKAMHPELKSNIAFVNPNLFALTIIAAGKTLIKTAPCAMTNLTVNYLGSNIPAFHKDGVPVHTVLTIELQELSPNVKQSIDALYR